MNGFGTGRIGDHLKIGVRHGLYYQVPGILIRELSSTLTFLRRPVILPLVVIEDRGGGGSADISVVKRANDAGEGDARNAEGEADRLQVELFNRLAYAARNLGQKSAQRPQPLTAGALADRVADE